MTIVVLVVAGFITCKDEGTPPPGYQRTISLTAEDLGTTEAWLRVRFADAPPYSFRLMRDSHTVATVFSAPADTLIGDETLLPSRTYTYRAYRLWGAAVSDSSEAVTVRTMDTTSSAWHWALDTLGDMNSYLVDCAIINDTLIYAVGEIYKRDSVGNWDPTPYGLAIWDGSNWTLRKLFAQYPGVPSPSLVRPHGIFAFSQRDIWFADADVFWWDGQSQLLRVHQVVNTVLLPGQYVDKLWGSSPSNIYAVGINGAIAHYDGLGWRRLESGTTLPINDIWGDLNARTGQLDVIAVAGDPYHRPERKILKISGSSVIPLSDSGIDWGLTGVWFCPQRYWVIGSGIWYKSFSLDAPQWEDRSNVWTQFTTTRLRGNTMNDLFVVGHGGEVLHFNGVTMRSFRQGREFYGYYNSVAVQDNNVIAVGIASFGLANNRAVILRGVRQN